MTVSEEVHERVQTGGGESCQRRTEPARTLEAPLVDVQRWKGVHAHGARVFRGSAWSITSIAE